MRYNELCIHAAERKKLLEEMKVRLGPEAPSGPLDDKVGSIDGHSTTFTVSNNFFSINLNFVKSLYFSCMHTTISSQEEKLSFEYRHSDVSSNLHVFVPSQAQVCLASTQQIYFDIFLINALSIVTNFKFIIILFGFFVHIRKNIILTPQIEEAMLQRKKQELIDKLLL